MEINGKTFLVSGGGSGLGAATAQALVEAGANVVLADLNPQASTATAEALGSAAHAVVTDVADEVAVQAAIDAALNRFGQLDGAINCAGIGPAERILGKQGPHRSESFSRVLNVNLLGTFNVLRLAAAVMQANPPGPSGERGVIVNTASVAAFDGQIGQAAYAASKGGIVAMTLPAARELARFGIRVMTIAPGIFATPLLAAMPEDVRQSLGAQVPFPSRLGSPAEYAALVCHIIQNQMLNGEVIRLDGAIRMAAK
ncbi:MAG: SDR family NAD(P)-dependent oxidoreductase [Oscillochloridaceae bacterium umkhey_bin13]